jgi:hypothetical protein
MWLLQRLKRASNGFLGSSPNSNRECGSFTNPLIQLNMKLLVTLSLALTALSASAQWQIHKVSDDPFEAPYTICANNSSDGKMMMKMERDDKKDAVWLYVNAQYICEDNPMVQISVKINDVWESIFSGRVFVANHKLVLLSRDFHSLVWADKFLEATEVAIKIKDSTCDNEQGIFNNTGARKAASSWNTTANN